MNIGILVAQSPYSCSGARFFKIRSWPPWRQEATARWKKRAGLQRERCFLQKASRAAAGAPFSRQGPPKGVHFGTPLGARPINFRVHFWGHFLDHPKATTCEIMVAILAHLRGTWRCLGQQNHAQAAARSVFSKALLNAPSGK